MKTYLIKRICIVLSFLFCFSFLTGCDSEEDIEYKIYSNEYEIQCIDGQYYMIFEDYRISYYGFDYMRLMFHTFSSLQLMLESIKNNQFDHDAVKLFPRNEIGTPIFNLEEPTIPILPMGYPDVITAFTIHWHGENYSFLLGSLNQQNTSHSTDNCLAGGLEFCIDTEEKYLSVLENDFTIMPENSTEPYAVEDRKATEYEYTDSYGTRFRVNKYSMIREDGKQYVKEWYIIKTDDSTLNVSDTVPYSVQVYAETDTGYFRVSLNDLKERPSEEWLLSFDTTVYESGMNFLED